MTNHDLIDEINHLKSLGMLAVDEAFDMAKDADITLYSTISKRDAAMHLMRFGIQKIKVKYREVSRQNIRCPA